MRGQRYLTSLLGSMVISLTVSCPASAQIQPSVSEQNRAQSSSSHVNNRWKEEESNPTKLVFLRLQVPFSVSKGQLAICIKHAALPLPKSLYLISLAPPVMPSDLRGSDWARCLFEVKTLNDLRGYVHIQTPQQALAYVRLPLVPPRMEVEVVARRGSTYFWNGLMGELDEKWAKRYPGLFATCTRSQDGFLVKRTLLVQELNSSFQHHLEQVEEWIGQDGSYLVKKRTRLPASATPAVKWFILMEE